ncbi:hypothetical protein PMIN06_007595 [Paraphaeosphaeria minitans]
MSRIPLICVLLISIPSVFRLLQISTSRIHQSTPSNGQNLPLFLLKFRYNKRWAVREFVRWGRNTNIHNPRASCCSINPIMLPQLYQKRQEWLLLGLLCSTSLNASIVE